MMDTAIFVDRDAAARLTADALLDVDAVLLRPEEPFTYTSGLKSPVYVDCRKLIGFPRLRRMVVGLMAGQIIKEAGTETFDVVAGGETAGIAYAAWLSDVLALPMVYVRKAPKGFGRLAQIEGDLPPGRRVLLVEDLATDGGSKLKFASVLRAADASIAHCCVVFHHDIFPQSVATLTDAGIKLHALARWSDVLARARVRRSLDPGALEEVDRFLADPYGWSAARGGIAGPG